MSDLSIVEQVDRDAAKPFFNEHGPGYRQLVLAFARHRASEAERVREAYVAAWKACQQIHDESRHATFEGLDYRRGFSAGASGCIAAVLALLNSEDAAIAAAIHLMRRRN